MFNKQHQSARLAIPIVALLVLVPGVIWLFRNMVTLRENKPRQTEISTTTMDATPITSTPVFTGNQENSFSVTSLTPTPFDTGNQDGSFPITPTKQPSRAKTIPSSPSNDIQSQLFIVVSNEYTNSFGPVTPMPQNFPVSLDDAEALAGFKILEPTFLPDGYVLFAIDYSTEDQHVGLLYYKPSNDQSPQVYFLQQRTAFSEHQSVIGVSALIQKLQVNDIPAEYVQGGFDDAGSSATVDRLSWNPSRDLGRFRWEKDNYYFQISTGMGIDSTTLQRMAESLKQHTPTPNATPLPTFTFEEATSD